MKNFHRVPIPCVPKYHKTLLLPCDEYLAAIKLYIFLTFVVIFHQTINFFYTSSPTHYVDVSLTHPEWQKKKDGINDTKESSFYDRHILKEHISRQLIDVESFSFEWIFLNWHGLIIKLMSIMSKWFFCSSWLMLTFLSQRTSKISFFKYCEV